MTLELLAANCKDSTARGCGTKGTELLNGHSQCTTMLCHIRHIQQSELNISRDDILGRGVFGKCYKGQLAHLSVCVKVFRKEAKYAAYFGVEINLLSHCCHENLPRLYGIVSDEKLPKVIVMSLHLLNGNPVSVHKALSEEQLFTVENWKSIILSVATAVKYLHIKSILHNDIKGDNIVLEHHSSIRGVLIDLGKGCFIKDAKGYVLTEVEKKKFLQNHPQIAPDLVNGHCKQSTLSDIYSLGRVIKQVNDKCIKLPYLMSLSCQCTEYLCTKRPDIGELCTTLHSLFD